MSGGPCAGGWLSIGVGDLLLATVFPLTMRKGFGLRAGLAAVAVALGALAVLLAPPAGPEEAEGDGGEPNLSSDGYHHTTAVPARLRWRARRCIHDRRS